MNRKIVVNVLGKILIVTSILMLLPFFTALYYHEPIQNILAFAIPILVLFSSGMFMTIRRVDSKIIGIKEGLFITATTWIVMSVVGAFPFVISGEIPNYINALFEIASGFTTTGASCLTAEQLDAMSHSMLFWRSFSHWIGGMGILVFVMALIPRNNENAMHILRAESPGPSVSKLAAKMAKSSQILYIIYIFLTLVLIGLLMLCRDPNIGFFNAVCTAFGTAGTGGFTTTSAGIGAFGVAAQYIIAIFMIIFGINFSLFFLMLIGNFRAILRNDEIRWYLATLIIAVIIVTINVSSVYNNFEQSFRASLFQVASIISTTGFSTVDYANTWPTLSLMVIFVLMVVGSCAGSTAGGMKQSRIMLLAKRAIASIAKIFNPRSVFVVKMDGKPVDNRLMNTITDFAIFYVVIVFACAILTSIYNPGMAGMEFDPLTAITASISCISNVGPGLGRVIGPAGNFSGYSAFSKIVFVLEMIAGRLELIPIMILFNPATYKRKNSF